MCERKLPMGLNLLHALRIGAGTRLDRQEAMRAWLTLHGMDAATSTIEELARSLSLGGHRRGHLAPSGEPTVWPHEQALLEALRRVDHDPDCALALLDFLPATRQPTVLALLSDLADQLSLAVSARLRQQPMRAGSAALH